MSHRPYDQFKFANKIGSPAKGNQGAWIPSEKTQRARRQAQGMETRRTDASEDQVSMTVKEQTMNDYIDDNTNLNNNQTTNDGRFERGPNKT